MSFIYLIYRGSQLFHDVCIEFLSWPGSGGASINTRASLGENVVSPSIGKCGHNVWVLGQIFGGVIVMHISKRLAVLEAKKAVVVTLNGVRVRGGIWRLLRRGEWDAGGIGLAILL